MRWKLLALLALAGAAALAIEGSAAFDYATINRSASARIADTGSAYNSITTAVCVGSSVEVVTCSTNKVTNKATTAQSYQLLKAEPSNKVTDYGINGGTMVQSGWTGWSAERAIGSDATFDLKLAACNVECIETKTYNTYWTVEGQKANTLDFTATRIMITIQYP